MDENNRKILVEQQIAKALRFLKQAEEMHDMHYCDLAANRYYYACFHAIQALFIKDGISAHTHSGVLTQFSLNYVKTGVVEIRFGAFLARMMQLRQKADYNCSYDITEEEILDIRPLATKLVDIIQSLL
ncbi:MAG: HEPN domain-containing protein [Prevotella sp.]